MSLSASVSWLRSLAGLSVMLALVCGCKKESAPNPSQQRSATQIPVSLQPAVLQDVLRTVPVIGELRGDEHATISAKVPGRIAQILKDVGDRVGLNEPLAQIDKVDYQLARNQAAMALGETLSKLGLKEMPPENFDPVQVPTVQRAKLQVQNARSKLERGRKVASENTGAISEQELGDLQTAYDVAQSSYDVELLAARSTLALARAKQSELHIASQRLEDSTVRAPASALSTPDPIAPAAAAPATRPSRRYAVAARLVSPGEYVQEGAPLFRLVADDPIKYNATLPERYLADIKVGQNVLVSVAAYREPFTGKLARINPQIDPLTRRLQVEVIVPNPQGKLQPGSFATGDVQTTLEKQVTFVPASAVVSFAGVQKVFTIQDNKAVEHAIETGTKQGNYIEVIKGLKGAQPVVTSGANKLANGIPVTIAPTESAQSPSTQPASADLPAGDS